MSSSEKQSSDEPASAINANVLNETELEATTNAGDGDEAEETFPGEDGLGLGLSTLNDGITGTGEEEEDDDEVAAPIIKKREPKKKKIENHVDMEEEEEEEEMSNEFTEEEGLMEMEPEEDEVILQEPVGLPEEIMGEEEESAEESPEDEPDVLEEQEPDVPMIPQEDSDDPDNLVNLMLMEAAEGDDDDLHTLFMGDFSEAEQEVDTLANIEGVVGIDLSEKTKEYFELEDLSDSQKTAWLNWKKVKLHMYTFEEESEFFPHYEAIKYYPDLSMLMGIDTGKQTGHDYYLCLTTDARNRVLHPPKKKAVFVDLKKKEEERWNEMASIAPRKWRGFGSELEVDEQKVYESRPLINVQVSRLRTYFGDDCQFQDSSPDDPNMFASFDSEDPSSYPSIQTLETDRGIQVMAPTVTASTQTGLSFKRNKMTQHSVQAILDENADSIMKSKNMATFFKSSIPKFEKIIQQNEMVDLLYDDYKNLKAKRGHEMEFSTESLLLQEYQTYSDSRHSKGRTVTCMTFHPALEDVVVMALGEDVTFDKRIESHSKVLMEPNFVLFWDLRDSSHPQIMLDAPSDVFSFMINPSDPHLVCGGCANGQVALWDLGRTYYELRAKTQDRRKKSSMDSNSKRPSFLEKLKDSAEKYVCPLIPTAGLSNLDQSHKKVVTSTAWLPPHVELGRTGTMYENSVGGHSVQFFSIAGDGTLKLWDIRVQKEKLGMEDFETETSTTNVIKTNPWAHLDNNQWKFTLKYSLDDGSSGSMYATLMSLSETRPGDTINVDQEDSQESLSGKELSSISKNKVKTGTSSKIESKKQDSETGTVAVVISGSEDTVDEGGFGTTKKQGVLTALVDAQTSIFMGTETGQIGLVDWLRNKDSSVNPEIGNKVCQNIYIQTYHDGAITSISRSPFYNDLILVVGGGTITIWKERSAYPILQCCGSELFFWCATWSNSRPAVFYVGTREGSIAVWDLLDRSNGPVMSQQVSNVRITGIALPKVAASASKKQFVAVSDSEGFLYLLVLPRFYARPLPHEDGVMTELMNREDTRMNEWVTEEEARMQRIQAVHDGWKDARVVKTQEQQDDEEIEQEERLSKEYLEFLEFQAKIVLELKREEPSLPTSETDISDEFEAMVLAAQEAGAGDGLGSKESPENLTRQPTDTELFEILQDIS